MKTLKGNARRMPLIFLDSLMAAVLCSSVACAAELELLGTTLDGVGGISSNKVTFGDKDYRHVSAGLQPGGVIVAETGTSRNCAGFLPAVTARNPGLDHDGDGIPDELDPDNDGDGLADGNELDGSAFAGYAATDPNKPDTDGDHMDDGAEAAGMYDPLDPNHCLEIVRLTRQAQDYTLRWIGKGGGTTNAIFTDGSVVDAAFSTLLIRQPYAGGAAPWYKTTNTYTWAGAAPRQFLRVKTE